MDIPKVGDFQGGVEHQRRGQQNLDPLFRGALGNPFRGHSGAVISREVALGVESGRNKPLPERVPVFEDGDRHSRPRVGRKGGTAFRQKRDDEFLAKDAAHVHLREGEIPALPFVSDVFEDEMNNGLDGRRRPSTVLPDAPQFGACGAPVHREKRIFEGVPRFVDHSFIVAPS